MDKITQLFRCALIAASVSFIQAQDLKKEEAVALVDARDELGSIENYIADRKSKLTIEDHDYCMFGCPQDPRKAAVIEQKRGIVKAKPATVLPLQDIVNALPVTMIDPLGDRVILRGSPPISKGEILEMAFRGETVQLRFEGARPNGAYFREIKSKKLALRKMFRLPKGIHQGTSGREITRGIQKVSEGPQKIQIDLQMPSELPPN